MKFVSIVTSQSFYIIIFLLIKKLNKNKTIGIVKIMMKKWTRNVIELFSLISLFLFSWRKRKNWIKYPLLRGGILSSIYFIIYLSIYLLFSSNIREILWNFESEKTLRAKFNNIPIEEVKNSSLNKILVIQFKPQFGNTLLIFEHTYWKLK